MSKYKIAFVKFGGLAAGGTERWLQMMAANVDRSKFEIDYYYCDAAPYVGSDYKHADTDPHRKKYMEDHDVNIIKFHVGAKDITKPHHPWVDTDFWDVFDGSKYDLVQTAKAGHPEYPYVEMKNKVVEYVTLTGMVDNSPNTVKTIHISHWSKEVWLKAGGNPTHAEVIYIPVEEPCTNDTFREELVIPDDAVICGFHQRNDNNIASDIQLAAIHRLNNSKVHTIVLGGGERYRKQAQQLGMQNVHFLPHTGDQYDISKFLNTLDIYTHGRSDGETFGTVLAEAMIHGKPTISHYVRRGANAMPETIGPAGYVVGMPDNRSIFNRLLYKLNSKGIVVKDYSGILNRLISDRNYREELGYAGRNYAKYNYSIESSVKKLEVIWINLLEPDSYTSIGNNHLCTLAESDRNIHKEVIEKDEYRLKDVVC
jgi:glycosyltransferase involved in cell wall biosynthesis